MIMLVQGEVLRGSRSIVVASAQLRLNHLLIVAVVDGGVLPAHLVLAQADRLAQGGGRVLRLVLL